MTKRTLFELTTEDGCSIGPYVWRVKFALARKGLAYQSRPVGFTEIASVGDGSFRSVPILQDHGEWIGDSWAIADYLDRNYPDQPLFTSPAERGMALFFEKWLAVEVVSNLFRICVLDIHDRLRQADRRYFRESRETRLGRSLEEVHSERELYMPILRERLLPLRLAVRDNPFLGGSSASYADYMAAGAFIWAGSVATANLLPGEDALLSWLNRCLALYGGKPPSLPGLVDLPPSR